MKTNHEIALKAAVDYLKFKLGDRKGFNVYDIDASDADELITEIEQECAKSFMDFLAAVDAERGKDAVGWMWQHEDTGNMVVVDQWQIDNGWEEGNPRIHLIGPLFLSPTIPDGMALVPIEPTLDMGWAYLDAARESSPECEHVFNHPGYRAMIKAAGVTK